MTEEHISAMHEPGDMPGVCVACTPEHLRDVPVREWPSLFRGGDDRG